MSDAAGNPIDSGGLAQTFHHTSRSDDTINELLSLQFRAKPGAVYSIKAEIDLSVFASKWFSNVGMVTADFSNTFAFDDPAMVFQFDDLDPATTNDQARYTASAPSMGLIDNQVPALLPEAVPVPGSGALMAGLVGLAGLRAWRRTPDQTVSVTG